jgi:hypothetical protein
VSGIVSFAAGIVAGLVASAEPAGEAAAPSARPHSTQNFAPAINGAPQCGQNLIVKIPAWSDSYLTRSGISNTVWRAGFMPGVAIGYSSPEGKEKAHASI